MALAEPQPPIASPTETASATGEIALVADKGGYSVSGRINGATAVKFVVDSGADVVSLPSDLVDSMLKDGTIRQSDIRGRGHFVAADGKRHKSVYLTLRQLDIGGHTVTNVEAATGPANNPPLLGQSFLAKFKSWTLDNKRHVLLLVE